MANKRRKSNKAKRKRNLFKCRPRSLDQLKRWEYLRFQSALNAAANFNKEQQVLLSVSTNTSSDIELLSIDQSLMENPFTCGCLMLALLLMNCLHGSYAALRRILGLKGKDSKCVRSRKQDN